jgi:hypothetical protein
MKIEVRKQGRYYTLNGEIVKPDKFFAGEAFKGMNHIVAWVMGGAHGEPGGVHLDRFRRYLEKEIVGNGLRRCRLPIELMFWDAPYFDLPEKPNVANTYDLVNLATGTGSQYHMTSMMRKCLRMAVNLAREFDIIFELVLCWTVKGRGPDDPRQNVAAWNEHLIGNEAEGIGKYLFQLRTEGDGEGEHRVDPGGLNLLADAANEYTVHAEVFTQAQLQNVARRWHERDAKGELLLISQSGAADRYDPPLASLQGTNGYDGVCLHPPRDGAWESTGTIARNKWPNELIDFNESQMGWTEELRSHWVPLIPKWAGLGTTDMDRWEAMHRNFIENDVYTTFHTFRGMDSAWPESPQSAVEERIREITGVVVGPPPPPPPPDPPPVTGLRIVRNDEKELIIERDPEVVLGGDEANVLKDSIGVILPAGRRLERLHVFHGLDRGDIVEMDTEIHANGKTLYVRSDHKETSAPYDAWETWDPPENDLHEDMKNLEIHVVCRVNGRRLDGKLQARPHWGIRVVFE